MKAINLRTEHLIEPMGLENRSPLFSWQCDSGIRQTACRIIVSAPGGILWESGDVESSVMSLRYPGRLPDRTRIIWTITLRDENGVWGESASASLETGFAKGENWGAKWIDPEPEKIDPKKRYPASVLRRTFIVGKNGNSVTAGAVGNVATDGAAGNPSAGGAVGSARLYITCHGLYEAVLNGKRVGDFVLAPGVDEYAQRTQYQIYDVTDLLKPGKNELTVTIGDGWYRGCNGIDGHRNLYGDRLALLCRLDVDGSPVLVSDEKWQASQSGPIRFSDMEQGEICDAHIGKISDWHKVKITDFGFSQLCCSDSVPITENETFEGKLIRTPNGETVVDFGQNLAGYTRMEVTAKEGQTITLWHGETLDENGNFTQSNFDPGARNKEGGIPQKETLICREGRNVYCPKFSIFGFRYAKVETDIDLTDATFTAVAVYSRMEGTASFSCGDADVNRLFENSLWSMKSNFCDIPTDCPTRERSGWTGDAGVFAPTGLMLADCLPVLRKWLAEVRISQHKDGIVANISPRNATGGIISRIIRGSAGWGDAAVLVPWAIYDVTGDTGILEENYHLMTRWVDFCAKRARKNKLQNVFQKIPYKKYYVDSGFHFGEWLEPDISSMDAMRANMKNGCPEVATAYLFRSADLLARAAALLGKQKDAEKYRRIAIGAKKAYLANLTQDGTIRAERQAAYVRPVAFGILKGKKAKLAAQALQKKVRENGNHLNTGFLATPYLCAVLADHGCTETAYDLLLQPECPGWLYAVKKGATSIWETWDGIRPNGTVHDSFNHYSYGAVSGWLIDGVCGIRLHEGKLSFIPHPDQRLGHAEAKWKSPFGNISASWRYDNGKLTYRFTVPANMTAAVSLPDGRTADIGPGTYDM